MHMSCDESLLIEQRLTIELVVHSQLDTAYQWLEKGRVPQHTDVRY